MPPATRTATDCQHVATHHVNTTLTRRTRNVAHTVVDATRPTRTDGTDSITLEADHAASMPRRCARDIGKEMGMTDNGEFYGVHYYEELQSACDKVNDDIQAYVDRTSGNDDLKPVVYYTHRIKSPQSLKAKLAMRGLPQTYESALENGIHDIVGFRIVCAFQEDVYTTEAMFLNNPDYEIMQVKDYIAEPKPNGYRSLHLITRLTNGDAAGVYVEIQIRTIAMDTWATLEHKLKYKKDIDDGYGSLTAQLRKCADDITSVDCDMSAIRDVV